MLWTRAWRDSCKSVSVKRAGMHIFVYRTAWSIVCWHLLMTCTLIATGVGDCDAAERVEQETETPPPAPEWIKGKITAIIDGDTVHLTAEDANYVIDLAGIDAPEKGQRSGKMAAQVLYLKTFEKEVRVLALPAPSTNPIVHPVTPTSAVPSTSPRSKVSVPLRHRVFGIIYCDGCVNSDLVREGLAWHDAQACPSTALAEAEATARKGRRGLWQGEQEPIPPWQWRRQRTAQPRVNQDEAVADLSRLFEARTPAAVIEAAVHVQPAPLASAKPEEKPAVSMGGDYWLTTSSGIRHNSKCRYYKKSKGRPCNASEGRPCQKCGG